MNSIYGRASQFWHEICSMPDMSSTPARSKGKLPAPVAKPARKMKPGSQTDPTLLAWLVFGESFACMQALGFVLLRAGIYLAARGEGR